MNAARQRLPDELKNITNFEIEIGDFDEHWTQLLKDYTAMREATKRKRMRNNPLRRTAASDPSLDHHGAGGRTR